MLPSLLACEHVHVPFAAVAIPGEAGWEAYGCDNRGLLPPSTVCGING